MASSISQVTSKLSASDPLAPYRRLLDGQNPTSPVRSVFAAAHVVMQPTYRNVDHRLSCPGNAETIAGFIDWPTTMSLRRRLDKLGFGVAEAMDTAQRFYLGWTNAKRLIQECGRLNLTHGFIAGAGVDQLPKIQSTSQIIDAVVEQARYIHQQGGQVIILPLTWLSRNQLDEQTYVDVYQNIVDQLDQPICVHWLGEMFYAPVKGYFPGDSFSRIMAIGPDQIIGCKLSLLDDKLEHRIRQKLSLRRQIVWTGDDFHFGRLIFGGDPQSAPKQAPAVADETTFGGHQIPLGDFSHALLGVFDGAAAPAALALKLLAAGETDGYRQIMNRAETLGRWVFQTPTQHYKAGLAFISWLNGWQNNFMLVNHEENARDLEHYLKTAELAAQAGALTDIPMAVKRLESLRNVYDR